MTGDPVNLKMPVSAPRPSTPSDPGARLDHDAVTTSLAPGPGPAWKCIRVQSRWLFFSFGCSGRATARPWQAQAGWAEIQNVINSSDSWHPCWARLDRSQRCTKRLEVSRSARGPRARTRTHESTRARGAHTHTTRTQAPLCPAPRVASSCRACCSARRRVPARHVRPARPPPVRTNSRHG